MKQKKSIKQKYLIFLINVVVGLKPNRIQLGSVLVKKHLKILSLASLTGAAPLVSLPSPVAAYPVDCAILLCIAGGFPANAHCARARAVMIRRITPYPITPPLQIWNCPMSGGISIPSPSTGADIDMSAPEFDFAHSIEVFDVRHYSYKERGKDDDCEERYTIVKGTYSQQGVFSWSSVNIGAVPYWLIPQEVRSCYGQFGGNGVRAVGIRWNDEQGIEEYEVVEY